MDNTTKTDGHAIPWNKGKLLGQKPPLKLKEDLGFPDSTATCGSRGPTEVCSLCRVSWNLPL
jgi:hypothetical protein